MSGITAFIKDTLDDRRKKQQYRSLKTIAEVNRREPVVHIGEKRFINFCSNDYLGLSTHPLLLERSTAFVQRYGIGSTASRLVCGNMECHGAVEHKLAEWLETESALLFCTGYQANATILSSLADRNSLILADKLSHNSLLHGALVGQARFIRFRHNDMEHLRLLLDKEAYRHNRVFILTESIFSMDGDRCNMPDLLAMSREYNAFLYVDEAHAIGVTGHKGRGLSEAAGTDLYLGTLGKSFGVMGAFAAGARTLRDYLINYCPGFIYSTGLSPAVVGAIDAAIELIPGMDEERKRIADNARFLRSRLNEMGFDTGASDSQIIPVIVGSEKKAVSLSAHLENDGYLVSAIRPPTVPDNSSRLRLTITALHNEEHIASLLQSISSWNA